MGGPDAARAGEGPEDDVEVVRIELADHLHRMTEGQRDLDRGSAPALLGAEREREPQGARRPAGEEFRPGSIKDGPAVEANDEMALWRRLTRLVAGGPDGLDLSRAGVLRHHAAEPDPVQARIPPAVAIVVVAGAVIARGLEGPDSDSEHGQQIKSAIGLPADWPARARVPSSLAVVSPAAARESAAETQQQDHGNRDGCQAPWGDLSFKHRSRQMTNPRRGYRLVGPVGRQTSG